MSLTTWWLENRLRGVDGKLRRLRFAQKRARDAEAELARAKRAGLSAAEAEARATQLHERRERLASEISALVDEEHRLKARLRALGVSLTSH